MGHSVGARCKCGYKEKMLMIGGGKLDFQYNCSHPALCESGKHIATVNLFDKEHRCPDGHPGHPKPYVNTPELQREPGNHRVSQWDDHELNDGAYLCPACGEYELHFGHWGLQVLFD